MFFRGAIEEETEMATVKIAGSFSIFEVSGNAELTKSLTEATVVQEYTSHKLKVAASTFDFEINFGGVSPGKKIYFRSSLPIGVKLNSLSGPLIQFSGISLFSGELTSMYVTTGNSEVEIEMVVAG